MKPQTTRLVLIYGGRSAEHDVSRTTALHVLRAVDPARYEVEAIGIATDGKWWRLDEEDIGTALSGGFDALPIRGECVSIDSLVTPDTPHALSTVVFPLLHGPLGEDGTIQGMFEMFDLAYVGSGVLGSALAMDKSMAKAVCASVGIPQARHIVITSAHGDRSSLTETVVAELGLPCFVKPANMGSSVGVSRVTSTEQLLTAVDHAFTYDRTVVIEEAIVGREIEVAVLGNDFPVAFAPGEVIPADTFYSYADKYLDGRSTCVVPASVGPEIAERVQALAIEAFTALRCRGLARCDFFLEENGRGLLLNEVNTMPGFTPISMYPKMVINSGISYPALIDRLVELASEEHRARPRRVDH